jgi:uncharacterized LabA/DUF88 family protein
MPAEQFKLEDVLYKNEKVAIFIDGANLYGAAKALGLDIDYRKLKQQFSRMTQLVRIYYYTAIIEDAEYSPVRPLVDWLDYNGYTLVTKPVREYTDILTGRKKYKANMDIDLAVDAMSIAHSLDHVIIVSGDGDYKRLTEALQKQGCRVSVISTIITQPPMISDELRRQADTFIELENLKPYIERDIVRSANIDKQLKKLPMNFNTICD